MTLDESKVLEWKQTIEYWQQSSLSLSAWCRENCVSIDKMNYWRAKLNLYQDKSILKTVLEAFPSARNIYLFSSIIHVRKSYDYLRCAIDRSLSEVPFDCFFVFLCRRRHLLKIYSSNSNSEMIWCKRLNRGTFSFENTIKFLEKKGGFYVLKKG
jgi:hypothetical protein